MQSSGLISYGNCQCQYQVAPATCIPGIPVETYRQGLARSGLQSPVPHKMVPNKCPQETFTVFYLPYKEKPYFLPEGLVFQGHPLTGDGLPTCLSTPLSQQHRSYFSLSGILPFKKISSSEIETYSCFCNLIKTETSREFLFSYYLISPFNPNFLFLFSYCLFLNQVYSVCLPPFY